VGAERGRDEVDDAGILETTEVAGDVTLVSDDDDVLRPGRTFPVEHIADLLTLVNAVAWASEQAPDDTDLLNRLLALVIGSLRT
jgi:hypothetical protein